MRRGAYQQYEAGANSDASIAALGTGAHCRLLARVGMITWPLISRPAASQPFDVHKDSVLDDLKADLAMVSVNGMGKSINVDRVPARTELDQQFQYLLL